MERYNLQESIEMLEDELLKLKRSISRLERILRIMDSYDIKTKQFKTALEDLRRAYKSMDLVELDMILDEKIPSLEEYLVELKVSIVELKELIDVQHFIGKTEIVDSVREELAELKKIYDAIDLIEFNRRENERAMVLEDKKESCDDCCDCDCDYDDEDEDEDDDNDDDEEENDDDDDFPDSEEGDEKKKCPICRARKPVLMMLCVAGLIAVGLYKKAIRVDFS